MSGHRRREARAAAFWVVLLLLAAGGWWWYDRTHPPSDEPPPPAVRPAGAQEVVVNFLQDGDSLDVTPVAAGGTVPGTDPVQLRLLGIDAPEMHGSDGLPQCFAEQAREELRRYAPPGGRLWISHDLQIKDKYHRYLVYAWTAEGTFVNLALAQAGAVRELSISPNDAYEPQLRQGFTEAREAERGLWGTCPT